MEWINFFSSIIVLLVVSIGSLMLTNKRLLPVQILFITFALILFFGTDVIVLWMRLIPIFLLLMLLLAKGFKNSKFAFLLLIPIAIRYSVYFYKWSAYNPTYRISLLVVTLVFAITFLLPKHRDIPLAIILGLFAYFWHGYNMPYACLMLTAYLIFLCTQNYHGSAMHELFIRIGGWLWTHEMNIGFSYKVPVRDSRD